MTANKSEKTGYVIEKCDDLIKPNVLDDDRKFIEKSEQQKALKPSGKRRYWIDQGGAVVFDHGDWLDYLSAQDR
ncbi:MAG TPA: hypothetical protein PLF71_03120 [bacterium]|nr:MAG: hypothetical protein BWY14_00266 [Parcubacteria group bacterium ADurb.Bin192]HPN15077.1 hypothetical protein [bacterium]